MNVFCPACHAHLAAPESAVGKQAQCSKCQHQFMIAEPPVPAAPATSSPGNPAPVRRPSLFPQGEAAHDRAKSTPSLSGHHLDRVRHFILSTPGTILSLSVVGLSMGAMLMSLLIGMWARGHSPYMSAGEAIMSLGRGSYVLREGPYLICCLVAGLLGLGGFLIFLVSSIAVGFKAVQLFGSDSRVGSTTFTPHQNTPPVK